MPPHTFIFIGPSGSGKGTQAALLQQYIKERDPDKREIFYQQTGANFRDFWKTGTFNNVRAGGSVTHERSKQIYEEGDRQPGFLAALMWGTAMVQNFKGTEHLFFDGTPRSLREAHILETALDFYERGKVYVVYLNVSREVSIERLLKRAKIQGREDDQTREGIEERLDWFEEDSLPAIDFFEGEPRYEVLEVDGDKEVEDIWRELREQIGLNGV